MSKNDTMPDTLAKEGYINRDENFKDVIRYKAIIAVLVKLTVPEFENLSIVEIAKLIKDRRTRSRDISDLDLLNDEADFLPTVIGTRNEKEIMHDSVLNMSVYGIPSAVDIKYATNEDKYGIETDRYITVNLEMQNITSESSLGYNPISRAIYYGSSLLRETVPAGDKEYKNIHKVYSVWFCSDDLNLDTFGVIPKDKYIHRFGYRRFYNDIKDKQAKREKASDLVEVVMVELNKMDRHIGGIADRLIIELFRNTKNFVAYLERVTKVNLSKVKKGVNDMTLTEERLRKVVAEAKEKEAEAKEKEAKAVKEAEEKAKEQAKEQANHEITKNYIESIMSTIKDKDAIIENTVKVLKVSKETATKAYSELTN